jgi:DUF971 family protein
VQWADVATSYYSILYLRRMSPSAEARELRENLRRNPLAVLPASASGGGTGGGSGALTALGAELVGRYALRIRFSDGHDTGIYSWDYLRSIDPAAQPTQQPATPAASPPSAPGASAGGPA